MGSLSIVIFGMLRAVMAIFVNALLSTEWIDVNKADKNGLSFVGEFVCSLYIYVTFSKSRVYLKSLCETESWLSISTWTGFVSYAVSPAMHRELLCASSYSCCPSVNALQL